MEYKKANNSLIYVHEEAEHQLIKSKKVRIILTISLIVVYFILYFLRYILGKMGNKGVILGVDKLQSPLFVLVSQLQICITVFFVMMNKKAGYIIDWIIMVLSLTMTLWITIKDKNPIGIQGVLSQVFTMVIVIFVYHYTMVFERKYNEVIKQREEILNLYSEIAASESTLIEQKNKLEGFNTMLEEREEELNQLAFFDPLTGLANRRMVIDRIDAMIQISFQEKRTFSIVFFDLDNFKKINDSAGHQVGDEVLNEIVGRWKRIIHKKDLLGRLGGDEFALVIQHPLNQDEVLHYVEQIKNTLDEGVYYKQRVFYIKASFGISMFPQDGSSSEYLLKYADVAMYQSKSSKTKKINFFNRDLQEHFQHTIMLENYMRQVLIRDELSIVFQPQYESETGKLRGFEALARWITKKVGFISPKEFIPIAEENGMIISMGEWILRESCRICKQWMDKCEKKFTLSVNISAVQLLDTGFISAVERVLEETGFDPNYLEMEVTETMFISSMDAAIETLNQLKKKGITIALDDFGTGYASLSYLQCLPIDTIKIDKSFIDGILNEKKHRALVKSIIGISHELALKVIAEGVEQQTQLEFLANVNCDYIQGYLLGKPLDAEQAQNVVMQSKETA